MNMAPNLVRTEARCPLFSITDLHGVSL
jgi:hypothetical protein